MFFQSLAFLRNVEVSVNDLSQDSSGTTQQLQELNNNSKDAPNLVLE